MATYTVSGNAIGSPAFALVASQVDTVTIASGNGPIEIISAGTPTVRVQRGW